MPGSSRGRRGRSAVSTRDIEMRSAEEEIEFRRELERVIVHPTHSQIFIIRATALDWCQNLFFLEN